MKLLGSLLAACGITAAFQWLFVNRYLSVDRYRLSSPRLPEGFEGKKIVLLADLHGKKFGKEQCNLLNSVEAASPDYIFFAGDLYSRKEKQLSDRVRFMKALNEIAQVYYVVGNHELNDPDTCEAMCHRLRQEGIIVLNNERVRIYSGMDHVNLYGLRLPLKYFINRNGTFCDLPVPGVSVLNGYLGTPDDNGFNMLLAHDPLFLNEYSEWGADMVFSGHVHGGLIRLPFIGGLLSPERKLFPKFTKGLYRIGKTVMALTSGLGKIRINNPSQVMVLELSKEETPKKRSKGKAWSLR